MRNRGVRAQAVAADRGQALARWVMAGLMALTVLMAALAAAQPAAAQTIPPQPQPRLVPDTFADLADRLLPAVVNISTTQSMRAPERMPEMPQLPPGSPFEDFFKEFFDRQGRELTPRKATSLGSGFIIDPSGFVVTNNHVIADADEITVILHDESALKATVVGRDSKTDLALLKVETKQKLPAVSFGDSDISRVGDWVLAIGNPFGLGGSVTTGIISARARDIQAGPYDDFIQTDASINRGNSGGPLFNLKGEVIGINTAIFSPSGGSIGIGFAIPSNMAKQVVFDLQKFGKTRRGWLGVRIQSVSDEIAETLGLKDPKGALVASVTPDGPAAKSGLRAGDVILKFDAKDIDEMRRLPRVVAETAIGRSVPVDVWREGKRQTLSVVVGELEESEEQELAQAEPEKPKGPAVGQTSIPALGLAVASVNAQTREKFELPPTARGVVVMDVTPGGPSAEKGVRPGDLIVEVGQEEIKTPADLNTKVDNAKKAGRKSVLMLVESEGGLRFVAVRLDAGTVKK